MYCTALKEGTFWKYSSRIDLLAHDAWPATLVMISQLGKKTEIETIKMPAHTRKD